MFCLNTAQKKLLISIEPSSFKMVHFMSDIKIIQKLQKERPGLKISIK